jgi:hypothetical protein
MKLRKQKLLAANSVDLIMDDPHNLVPDTLTKRKHRVHACHQLADVSSAHK